LDGQDKSPFLGKGKMPEVSHGDGAAWFLNTSLQILSRVEWKAGSFQIIAEMLSRPGVLLILMDLSTTQSSLKANGSVEMSIRLVTLMNGKDELSPSVGGG